MIVTLLRNTATSIAAHQPFYCYSFGCGAVLGNRPNVKSHHNHHQHNERQR